MRRMAMAGLVLLAGCGSGGNPAADNRTAADAGTAPPPAIRLTAEEEALLRSAPLRQAIHRALTTGQNQRWQDGALSGYAVPSLSPAPNGCRAVRYTVDQRPQASYQPINACEGSPAQPAT